MSMVEGNMIDVASRESLNATTQLIFSHRHYIFIFCFYHLLCVELSSRDSGFSRTRRSFARDYL